MQQFLNRLSWNNIPLRIKTTAIFVLQLVLIALIAMVGFVALNTVSTASSQTITTVVELRSISQDMLLKVGEMERVEETLNDTFLQPGFDPDTTQLPSQFSGLIDQINQDSRQAQQLSQQLGGPIAPSAFAVAVADIQTNLTKTQDRFNGLYDPIKKLTTANTGQLLVLDGYRQQLQTKTLQRGYPELVTQVANIQIAQNNMTDEEATDVKRIALHEAADTYIRLYVSLLPADLRGDEGDVATSYEQQIDPTYDLLRQVGIAHSGDQTQLTNLRSAISRMATLTASQTVAPLDSLNGLINQARVTLAVGLVVAVVAGAVVTRLFSRNLVGSVQSLLGTAQRLQAGDLKARVSVHGQDEFNRLGVSFNALAMQMDGLISGLEQRVAERARDLSITADIGRAVVGLPDPRDLMNEIVELIRQRFGFYHAQVFLVDDSGQNAVLVASTGAAGRELLARQHSIEVGSQSVIGQVTERGESVIASDTDVSAIHKRNELLPDTRSEMALPMRIGERVIGALDVQSVAPNAFEADSVAVFQIMADQLAIALENSRLSAKLRDADSDLRAFQQRVTREVWHSYTEAREANAPISFRFSEDRVEPHADDAPPPLSEAIRRGQLVTAGDGDSEIELAVPIRVRGEVIGAFGFGGEAVQNLTQEDIALVEAVVDRVGLALENLRLVEQTARRAEHEQLVNEITAKIVGSTDVNYILQTTVKELGRVLRAPQTSVQLRRERTDTSHE